jgi:hypothetical protein
MTAWFVEQSLSWIFLEIPLLIKQNDIPHITLFDSSQLHVNEKKLFLFLFFCIDSISRWLSTWSLRSWSIFTTKCQ